jgi:uncharacterized hydantoinase/oxoprolinase family protein
MVCADLETIGSADLTAIADHVARAQLRQIVRGIRQVMHRLDASCPGVAVLAGAGAFIARAAAEAAGLTTRDLAHDVGSANARAAPAAAVASLLSELVFTGGSLPCDR